MKKQCLLFILIILFCGISFAQNPAIEWQKCLGGSSFDVAHSIQQTTDGGYIIAGFTESNNGEVTGNHGGDDYWIVKLNSSGTVEWKKCLGGSSDDIGLSIKQTTDGGYIVAGYSKSNDGDVTGNHGGSDYWIVKLNSSGTIQWQKCLGGSVEDEPHSIQQTADGGYIVAGYSMSNNGDVSGNHGGSDYWIVKLNSSGTIVWQKCFGGQSYDRGFFIQQTSDGGYIVAGDSYSNDGDVSGNHSPMTDDYWIVKLNSSGTLQWQKCLGGVQNDMAWSIQQTTDGGYIIAGYSYSNDGDVTGHHGSTDYSDYWIVKLNSSGTIVWQKSLGGTRWETAYSNQQTTDGGYIVAGESYSNDGDVTGHNGTTGTTDYWIVKLNASGTLEWQKSFGGTSSEDPRSIQQTIDGGYIVAGYSMSNNGDVSGNHGLDDYWVVKLKPSAGIEEMTNGKYAILIYPNPANSFISIKLLENGKNQLYIYNSTGQEIMKVQDVKQNNSIDISKLPSGLYYIKVQSDKGMDVGKFIKQ